MHEEIQLSFVGWYRVLFSGRWLLARGKILKIIFVNIAMLDTQSNTRKNF